MQNKTPETFSDISQQWIKERVKTSGLSNFVKIVILFKITSSEEYATTVHSIANKTLTSVAYCGPWYTIELSSLPDRLCLRKCETVGTKFVSRSVVMQFDMNFSLKVSDIQLQFGRKLIQQCPVAHHLPLPSSFTDISGILYPKLKEVRKVLVVFSRSINRPGCTQCWIGAVT